MTNFEAAWSRK